MKKLFSRMTSEKVNCSISMKISGVQVTVNQPLILKLRWKRGPQTDTTETFEVSQDANTYQLNFRFERTSNFYRDGKGGYQRKTCNLELIYTSVDSEEQTGQVEIDMAPFVGKGETF